MNKPLVVAEIGINANGDIDIAKKLIDIAVEGECDFVKFQKRTPEICVPEEKRNMIRETPWGHISYMAYKEKIEFGQDEYEEIDKYCKEKSVQWYASPWDKDSVHFLLEFDVPYIKIPSALITNIELIDEIRDSHTPVIISCGMSSKEEVDRCLSHLGNQVKYILSCTSSYPTPINEMNMQRIITLQKEYGAWYKIGFSNHFKSIQFILQAYIMGCEMLEFHITLDRSMYGSDQAASIEPPGVYRIRNYLKDFRQGWGNGVIECQASELLVKESLRR